jgi:hypothetical protein
VPAELARDEGEIEGTAVAIGLVRALSHPRDCPNHPITRIIPGHSCPGY